MKKIVCEMCECTQFAKENGMFICQGCGLQYSMEEAKKLMVEVDGDEENSQQPKAENQRLKNLYERARKSLEVDDLEHAAEYYKQILDEVPNNWEAYFYSYLGETTSFTNAQAASVADKLSNTIPAACDMAITDGTAQEKHDRLMTISKKTADRLTGIALTGASLLREYEGSFVLSITGSVHADMYRNLRPTAQNTILTCIFAFNSLDEKIESLYKDKQAIDEKTYIECLLILRRAQFQLADMTFSPIKGSKEHLIKQEYLQSFHSRLASLEHYAAANLERLYAEERQKQWKERQAKNAAYWEQHAEEKIKLDTQKDALENKRSLISQEVITLQEQIGKLNDEKTAPLPEEEELRLQNQLIEQLNDELRNLGMFKSQEKKDLQQRINQELETLEKIKNDVQSKRQNHIRQIYQQVEPLQKALEEKRIQLQEKFNAIKAIENELNADH